MCSTGKYLNIQYLVKYLPRMCKALGSIQHHWSRGSYTCLPFQHSGSRGGRIVSSRSCFDTQKESMGPAVLHETLLKKEKENMDNLFRIYTLMKSVKEPVSELEATLFCIVNLLLWLLFFNCYCYTHIYTYIYICIHKYVNTTYWVCSILLVCMLF